MIQCLNASVIQYNESMNPTHPETLPVAAGQLVASLEEPSAGFLRRFKRSVIHLRI